MAAKQKKPRLTSKQREKIQWLTSSKAKGAIKVGRYKDYWILSQNASDLLLVYDQAEWDAFVSGVNNHEFDFLVKNEERR